MRWWGWIATLLVAVAIPWLWVRWSPLDANDVTAGEGYYGIQARSLIEGPPRWSPPLEPHGPPGFKPPLYPALLALSIERWGPTPGALRWPSILFAALTAVAAAALAARAAGPAAGPVAALLFLSLPWVADSSRFAASVIALTAFGAGAIALVAGGSPPMARAGLAGLLLGLAFQCKLWMAGLAAAPAAVALLPARGARARTLAVMVAIAIGVASVHLAGVAAFEPENLSRWLDFYFRRHLIDHVAATGFEYAQPLPPGWYWAIVADAWVLGLPLIAVGAQRALDRLGDPAARAAMAWALGLALLSVFTLKTGSYLYAVMPAFAVLAAIGAAAMAEGRARVTPLLIACALAGAPPVVAALGDAAPPLWTWAGAWLALAAALLLARRPRWRRPLALGLVALAAGGGLVRTSQRLPPRFHDPGYRAIASAMGPLLAGSAPGTVAYRAPDAPAFGYHLMRPGAYWWLAGDFTPRERAARMVNDPAMRVFVIDPSQRLHGGWPGDSLALAWLADSTREITGAIESRAGRRLGVRVFARDQGAMR